MLKAYYMIKSSNNFDFSDDSESAKPGSKRYVFKELVTKKEFMQMFALRYLVYRYVNFIESNRYHIDIDCYDLYSTFFGAYEVIGNTKKLISTVRIINCDVMSPVADMIMELADELNNGLKSKIIDRDKLFPILHTFNISEKYLLLNGNNGQSNMLSYRPYEISRLALLPEYWGSKHKIESGMHQLIILDAWNTKPKKNFYLIATHPRTKRRYKKLGFEIIPGTKERMYKPLKQLAIAMRLDLDKYLNSPNPYSELCSNSYDDYINKGYIVKE